MLAGMTRWEVTCPGARGLGARGAAADPPPLRRRSRAVAFTARAGAVPRATEPVGRDRRARASPRRFENHLNPNPQARAGGGTFARFKKRAGTGKRPAVDCRRFTDHDARGASVHHRARLLARRLHFLRAALPDRVDGRRRATSHVDSRAGVRKWIEPAQKSTASGSSPPKTAPLR